MACRTKKLMASSTKVKTFEGRLGDQEYANFLIVELCLAETKESLERYCDHISKLLQKDIIEKLRKMRYGSYPIICPDAYVKPVKPPKIPGMSCCQDCTQFINQLSNHCTKKFGFAFNWKNSLCQNWPILDKHWSLAKVFMTRHQDENLMTPADTDVSGILSFMLNCSKGCSCTGTAEYTEKVVETRNRLMHLSSLKLPNTDVAKMTDHMIGLLANLLLCSEEGLITEEQREDIHVAVLKIQKVRGPKFYITVKLEYKAMDNILHELETHKDGLLKEVMLLKEDCEKLAEGGRERNDLLLQELKQLMALKQKESDMFTNMYRLVSQKIQVDDGILKTMTQRIEIVGEFSNKMEVHLRDVTNIFREIDARHPPRDPGHPPRDPGFIGAVTFGAVYGGAVGAFGFGLGPTGLVTTATGTVTGAACAAASYMFGRWFANRYNT